MCFNGIQLYVLLSPYSCLIFLYLDLYVLGDDASIRYFMRTKHLCVLMYIGIKGEVGTVNMFKPSSMFTDRSKAVLLLWIFNISCLSLLIRRVCSLQPCTGKGLTSLPSCV